MSWYKKSSAAQLTDTVKKWIVQAYQGAPDMRLVDADLDQFTPSLEDGQSIEMGIQMAQTQLHIPELNTIQLAVVEHIRSRFLGAQMPQEPLDNQMDSNLPMTDNNTPEQPQNEMQQSV